MATQLFNKWNQVTEWQQGVAQPDKWPLGVGNNRGRISEYQFIKRDSVSCLYIFANGEDGRHELFARRKSGISGWHLKLGSYCYEFCRSI